MKTYKQIKTILGIAFIAVLFSQYIEAKVTYKKGKVVYKKKVKIPFSTGILSKPEKLEFHYQRAITK